MQSAIGFSSVAGGGGSSGAHANAQRSLGDVENFARCYIFVCGLSAAGIALVDDEQLAALRSLVPSCRPV